MKLITLLKILTIGMGLLVIVGMLFVVSKIAKPDVKSKSFSKHETEIELLTQEKVESITGCGNYLCTLLKGKENNLSILIIDPKTGQMNTVIRFKENKY